MAEPKDIARLYRSGLVMFVAGVAGVAIRGVLAIHHGASDRSDILLMAGSLATALVGLHTMRSAKRLRTQSGKSNKRPH